MIVAVIDTETTGIPSRTPDARIVEVGAVVLEWAKDGRITEIGSFSSLARPCDDKHRLPGAVAALEINKLTVEDVDAAPPDWQVGQALEAWLVERGVQAIGAYNAEFDFDPVLLGSVRWLARYLRVTPHLPCIMVSAKDKLGLGMYDRGGRLVEVCGRFKVPVLNAHEALADARMAAGVMPLVMDRPTLPALRPFVIHPRG